MAIIMGKGCIEAIYGLLGLKGLNYLVMHRGLQLVMYAPRGREGGHISYTFQLRITCKKGERGAR